MQTHIDTLIKALRILSKDIQSEDGVANACIAEAAQRLEEQQEHIKRLEKAGDRMSHSCVTIDADLWRKAKEAKP